MKDHSAGETVAFAPGRVNLIGEHTDYQGGYALPFAVQLGVTFRARPLEGGTVRLTSSHAGSTAEFAVGDSLDAVEPAWARYPAAVLLLLGEGGVRFPGFEARIESDLPVGAGLASSAALCVASALAALELARSSGAKVPTDLLARTRLAELCRDAEGLAAGVRCGLMDPYASLFGRTGMGLLLDCRSGSYEEVPLDRPGLAFLIADTGIRRKLSATDYNLRRKECEAAVERLRMSGHRILSARDLREGEAPEALVTLSDLHQLRIRHQCTENERTLSAKIVLEAGDADRLGSLVTSSHESLRDDYEVSCDELEAMVAAAADCPGVVGSRLTGAGFGGSVLTLVQSDQAESAMAGIRAGYLERAGRQADVRQVVPSGGAFLQGDLLFRVR